MKLSHPVGYSVADHAAKIFKTPAFLEAAKGAGLTAEQFQMPVAAELKRIVADQRAAELAEYEQTLGGRALTAAIEKLKAEQAA